MSEPDAMKVLAASEHLLDLVVPEQLREEVADAIAGLRQHIQILIQEPE